MTDLLGPISAGRFVYVHENYARPQFSIDLATSLISSNSILLYSVSASILCRGHTTSAKHTYEQCADEYIFTYMLPRRSSRYYVTESQSGSIFTAWTFVFAVWPAAPLRR